MAVVVVGTIATVMLWKQRRDEGAGPSPTWTAAISSPASAPGRPPAPLAPNDAAFDLARSQLAALAVHGWDRETDFKRYRFGKAWSDDVNVEFGHNRCNTRDDILRRDLANLVVRPGTCYAQSGVLRDRIRGRRSTSSAAPTRRTPSRSITWSRWPTPGTRVPCNWDDQRRHDFANDPRNLLAVSPKANFDKAFRDAAGGCRSTRRSGVPSSPGRSRSRRPIGSGCRPTRSGRWQTC